MTALKATTTEDADVARITAAINGLTEQELDALGAWQDLLDLSSRTIFEAIDGDPASVVVDADGNFEAIASVYVTLVYGSSRDEETMSDEYVATIGGTVGSEGAEITRAEVDTSSFYE